MPFDVLETAKGPPKLVKAFVTYMRYRRKGSAPKEGALPRLTITMPTSVFISKADRFECLVGSGADAGKLRIRAVKKGGVECSTLAYVARLIFGYGPKFKDEIFDAQACDIVRINDDEYELALGFDPTKEAADEKAGRRLDVVPRRA